MAQRHAGVHDVSYRALYPGPRQVKGRAPPERVIPVFWSKHLLTGEESQSKTNEL